VLILTDKLIIKRSNDSIDWKGDIMSKARLILPVVCAHLLLISLACPVEAQPATSAAEKLLTKMPDDVVGFVATSGGDDLKPAFEKTILGRIWNDPGVQTFREAVRKALLAKAEQEMPELHNANVFELGENIFNQVTARPFMIGVARKDAAPGLPFYGFAIIDAGPRKAEMGASLTKLESFAGEGDIVEIEIDSVKMHGPKNAGEVPGYWGWVGNYFVFAINDGTGLAMKYVQGGGSRPAPAYLQNVPGCGDALIVHVNREKAFEIVRTIAMMSGGQQQFGVVEAAIKELGLDDIKSFTERAGFDGADIACNCLLEMPQPRTGLLADFKPIDLAMFDMADPCAMSASVVNCDVAGIYDTAMDTARTALGNDFLQVEQGIATIEAELNFKIRQGLLESLSGPMLSYALPGGATLQSPQGGFVLIAGLKDAKLWEDSLTALGKFAAARSEGVVQVCSQVQDGLTVHTWAIVPLAIAQIMPSWTVVGDKAVIGSNPALLKSAVDQIKSGTKSIRGTAGFKKVTAKLPANLISFKYGNSKLQFTQLMTALQQFWPMATMAASNAGVKLPFVLPQLSHIARDMGPSCQYSWFDDRGLRSRYDGAGIEPSLGALAGGAFGAGIMMPALARAREQARQAVSMSNLRQLGLAIIMYADDHDGKLPDNLEQAKDYYKDSKVLESPLKPKDFDGPSYIYIPGHKVSDQSPPRHKTRDQSPATKIVIYENPAYLKDEVNVVFLDGHVEKMQKESFLNALKATYKQLGREMPEIKFKGSQ
jgi:prepilin-type processing-associated H-X9-DG protein